MKPTNKIFCKRIAGAAMAVPSVLALLAGCDESSSQSSAPTTKPTVAVTAPAAPDTSAILVSYPQKPPSFLILDGKDWPFPAAKLAVVGHGRGGYSLCLCSDDPPTAIDPGYAGNSYVLYMQMGIDKLSELPGATWDFKPADTGNASSGIYLHGNRDQYQPNDVHISFQKNGDELMVFMTGTFLHNDPTNPAAPADRVQVSATLRANAPTE